MATSGRRKESLGIQHLNSIWIFAAGLFLTAVGLCSGKFCRLVLPDTDQSHLLGPGVLRRTGGSQMKKRMNKRMRQMGAMKMCVG